MVNFKTIGYGGKDTNSLISALKEMNADAVMSGINLIAAGTEIFAVRF